MCSVLVVGVGVVRRRIEGVGKGGMDGMGWVMEGEAVVLRLVVWDTWSHDTICRVRHVRGA